MALCATVPDPCYIRTCLASGLEQHSTDTDSNVDRREKRPREVVPGSIQWDQLNIPLSTHHVNYSYRTPASDAEQTVCVLFMNPDARVNL